MELPKRELNIVLQSIVQTLSERDKLIYSIIIETACKTGELAGIKAGDVSREGIYFSGRKSEISERLYLLIREFVKNNKISREDNLFSTRQSEKISSKRIRQIIQQTSEEKIGYKIDPKDLRKYAIQNKIKLGNKKEIEKQVGIKRLDVRKYISDEQIKNLEKNIADDRTRIIFDLLLNNFKPNQIVNLTVDDILDSKIPKNIVDRIEKYISARKISFGEDIFKTRNDKSISKVMIFKIIKNLGKSAKIELNPRILNNTAIARAVYSGNSQTQLNALGVRTRAFHLHGNFIKNE